MPQGRVHLAVERDRQACKTVLAMTALMPVMPISTDAPGACLHARRGAQRRALAVPEDETTAGQPPPPPRIELSMETSFCVSWIPTGTVAALQQERLAQCAQVVSAR